MISDTIITQHITKIPKLLDNLYWVSDWVAGWQTPDSWKWFAVSHLSLVAWRNLWDEATTAAPADRRDCTISSSCWWSSGTMTMVLSHCSATSIQCSCHWISTGQTLSSGQDIDRRWNNGSAAAFWSKHVWTWCPQRVRSMANAESIASPSRYRDR